MLSLGVLVLGRDRGEVREIKWDTGYLLDMLLATIAALSLVCKRSDMGELGLGHGTGARARHSGSREGHLMLEILCGVAVAREGSRGQEVTVFK